MSADTIRNCARDGPTVLIPFQVPIFVTVTEIGGRAGAVEAGGDQPLDSRGKLTAGRVNDKPLAWTACCVERDAAPSSAAVAIRPASR